VKFGMEFLLEVAVEFLIVQMESLDEVLLTSSTGPSNTNNCSERQEGRSRRTPVWCKSRCDRAESFENDVRSFTGVKTVTCKLWWYFFER
jgi:hypothetical protein